MQAPHLALHEAPALPRWPGGEEAQTSPPKEATWSGLEATGRKMPVEALAASAPRCSSSIHCPSQEVPSQALPEFLTQRNHGR